MVIAQNAVTSLGHNQAMLFKIAPVCQRNFVAPGEKERNFPGSLQLSNRSAEMKASMDSSSGRNCAAKVS